MTDIVELLAERGSRYGTFEKQAEIAMAFKSLLAHYAQIRGTELADDQLESLHMIFNKLARILNGDPNYADSWADIAGYAKLISDRLEGVAR